MDINAAIADLPLGCHELDMDMGVAEVKLRNDMIDPTLRTGRNQRAIFKRPIDVVSFFAQEEMILGAIEEHGSTFGRRCRNFILRRFEFVGRTSDRNSGEKRQCNAR